MGKKICERLVNFAQIIDHEGTVRTCCWVKNNVIGSLYHNTMQEVYHSEYADKLRTRHMEGDYSLCEVDACPYLAMNDLETHLVDASEIPKYPQELHLAFEQVCNYHCTSCTVHDVMIKNKEKDLEKGYDIIEERLKEVLPHVKCLGANGCGELFVSKRILKLLKNWKPLAPKEEIQVILESNGSLFDETHWKQIENLGQYNMHVAITVMSFDEPTYQFLSGSSLPISKIEDNLRFIKSLREKGIINFLEIATVVQERNFRFLPEFTKRCVEEFGADYVRLRPYMPWGSQKPEVEWFTDIRNPRHPYHNEYKEIMKDPIFKHPKVHDWSGGLNTVHPMRFPYKLSYYKEQAITDIVLNIKDIVENLKVCMDTQNIAIYGLGNVGKVLIEQLRQLQIYPICILDKYLTCSEFHGIKVHNLKETDSFEKSTNVIITLLADYENVEKDLKTLGFNGEIIPIINLLHNKNIKEQMLADFIL